MRLGCVATITVLLNTADCTRLSWQLDGGHLRQNIGASQPVRRVLAQIEHPSDILDTMASDELCLSLGESHYAKVRHILCSDIML